jgi:hypothetical protein
MSVVGPGENRDEQEEAKRLELQLQKILRDKLWEETCKNYYFHFNLILTSRVIWK